MSSVFVVLAWSNLSLPPIQVDVIEKINSVKIDVCIFSLLQVSLLSGIIF